MIKWNEVTWYSKLMSAVFILGVLPCVAFYIGIQYQLLTQTIEEAGTAVIMPLQHANLY